eukprot:GEMP01009735.1.p1 GENE.GEMP01009735.1~~GEMP01009735.1.p1  ORF type:complete len:304 (+),score=96.84 GEMP01009735.1:32-913(+)
MILRLTFVIGLCRAGYYDSGHDGLDPLGKRKDVFDEVTKKQGRRMGAERKQPDCPTSDGLSPFSALSFVDGEIYVRRELDDEKPMCERLIQIAKSNVTVLMKAGKTCGPVGEAKRRIAQNLYAVFWMGGLDGWPTGEDKTIYIKTSEFEGEVELSAEKATKLEACWMEGCDCDQAKSPLMRIFFGILLAACIGGLGYDSLSLAKGKDKKKKKERDPAKKKERKEKKEKKEKKDKVDKDDKDDKEKEGDDDENDKDEASPDESPRSVENEKANDENKETNQKPKEKVKNRKEKK